MQYDRLSSLADELKQNAAQEALREAVRVDISHLQRRKGQEASLLSDRIADREMEDAERWDGMS